MEINNPGEYLMIMKDSRSKVEQALYKACDMAQKFLHENSIVVGDANKVFFALRDAMFFSDHEKERREKEAGPCKIG